MIPCFAETISKWVEFRKAFNRRLTINSLNQETKSAFHTKCSLYYNLESIRGTLLNTMRRAGDIANIPYPYASNLLCELDHRVKRISSIPTVHEPMPIARKGKSLKKRVISFGFHETNDYNDENRLLINPKCISEQETFQCRLSYLSVKWKVSKLGPALEEIPHHCLERLLLQACKIQDLCNFEFICKDNEVVTANKFILQIGCPYFRGAWDQMLLPEIQGKTVRAAIHFIFTGENPFEGQNPPDAVELLELSDEWLLRPLFEIAVHEIVKESTSDQGDDLIWLGTTFNSQYLVEVGKFYLRKSAVI